MESNNQHSEEESAAAELAEWQPRTKVGKMVKSGEITSVEQIFAMGKQIKEVEIVDTLLPGLENSVLEVKSVQRMTKNNRKQKFRATVVVGDKHGHVGIGTSKGVEVKPTIDMAIKDAKKNIISVQLGCGSWECNCGTAHSLPLTLSAKVGSVEVVLKPAPRGVGIVAGKNVQTVLSLAGIKDVWTFSRGRTRNAYNSALATYLALKKLSEMRGVESLNLG
ncbi:MAG: 30S ribosomal protein S5 [Candidatus Micrarchaeaceae archaeon]